MRQDPDSNSEALSMISSAEGVLWVAACMPEKGCRSGELLVACDSKQQQALHMLRLNAASAQVQWLVKMQFSNSEDPTFLRD